MTAKASGSRGRGSRATSASVRAEAAAELDIPVRDRTVVIDGHTFIAENAEKWDRAVNGNMGGEGSLVNGVGAEATPEAKLAQYDKLGGYITVDGRKVKNGAFFDQKRNVVIKDPQPVLLFRVNGEEVEVPVGETLPVEVQAAEIADKKKAAKAATAKGGKGSKKAAKPSVEDEE